MRAAAFSCLRVTARPPAGRHFVPLRMIRRAISAASTDALACVGRRHLPFLAKACNFGSRRRPAPETQSKSLLAGFLCPGLKAAFDVWTITCAGRAAGLAHRYMPPFVCLLSVSVKQTKRINYCGSRDMGILADTTLRGRTLAACRSNHHRCESANNT
eukprot:6470016-Prymnesium_polylepis.1